MWLPISLSSSPVSLAHTMTQRVSPWEWRRRGAAEDKLSANISRGKRTTEQQRAVMFGASLVGQVLLLSPIKSEVSLTRFCSVGSISSTNLERLLMNGRSIQKKTPRKSGKDFLRDLGYPCSICKMNGCSSTGAGCCERQGWRAGAGWDCSLGSDRGSREGRTAEHWEEIC